MKAGNQTLKDHLLEFLQRGEKTINSRIELFIVGVENDRVRVTDDYVHFFELHGNR